MLSLLLSTFEMMGLTFIIGFFVAGVIKIIAIWADSMDFYNSHQEEILRLKRLRKLHHKVAKLMEVEVIESYSYNGDKRENFSRGINDDNTDYQPGGYYHGVSHGASKADLLDYYYPEDTQLMYLKKQEQQLMKSRARNKKNNSSDNNNA